MAAPKKSVAKEAEHDKANGSPPEFTRVIGPDQIIPLNVENVPWPWATPEVQVNAVLGVHVSVTRFAAQPPP